MGLKKVFVPVEFGVCPKPALSSTVTFEILFSEGATPSDTQHMRWWKV